MTETNTDRTTQQRLEQYTDWMLLHEKAVRLGSRMGLPSALKVEECAAAMVAANFTPESITALEDAMQAFSTPFGYTLHRKDKS